MPKDLRLRRTFDIVLHITLYISIVLVLALALCTQQSDWPLHTFNFF